MRKEYTWEEINGKNVLVEHMTNRMITKSQVVQFEFPRNWWHQLKFENSETWWLSWLVVLSPVKFKIIYREVSCYHNVNPMLFFPDQTEIPCAFGRAVRHVDIDEGDFRVYNQAADHRATRLKSQKVKFRQEKSL